MNWDCIWQFGDPLTIVKILWDDLGHVHRFVFHPFGESSLAALGIVFHEFHYGLIDKGELFLNMFGCMIET